MGAAAGILGSARAQDHLPQTYLDVYPLNKPEVMIARAAQRFDDDGRLKDETSRTLIRDLLVALVRWTHRLNYGVEGRR
jgi:chromate reductase